MKQMNKLPKLHLICHKDNPLLSGIEYKLGRATGSNGHVLASLDLPRELRAKFSDIDGIIPADVWKTICAADDFEFVRHPDHYVLSVTKKKTTTQQIVRLIDERYPNWKSLLKDKRDESIREGAGFDPIVFGELLSVFDKSYILRLEPHTTHKMAIQFIVYRTDDTNEQCGIAMAMPVLTDDIVFEPYSFYDDYMGYIK